MTELPFDQLQEELQDYPPSWHEWWVGLDDEAQEKVHPMYCGYCGAEYGEDWAQCNCFDEV